MNQTQEIFGEPAESTRKKVRPYMVEWVQDFIKNSPFLVMASSNALGYSDASPRGGKPGFVKVIDEKHLVIPDISGNKLFQSHENIETNPYIGLIFFIPGIDRTARVNGKVKILREGDSEFDKLALEVKNKKLLQALMLEVVESYGHCTRALGFAKLWDTSVIMENQGNPLISKVGSCYRKLSGGIKKLRLTSLLLR